MELRTERLLRAIRATTPGPNATRCRCGRSSAQVLKKLGMRREGHLRKRDRSRSVRESGYQPRATEHASTLRRALTDGGDRLASYGGTLPQ